MTTDTPRVAAGNLGALEGRAALDAAISEKAFAQLVIDTARVMGWMVYRTFDSRRSPSGYPDLCMVRGSRFIIAELKTERGALRPDQREWLRALDEAVPEVHLWQPRDWDRILEVLR